MGVWGSMVRQWLGELLPEDAAEMIRGRMGVVVTKLPNFEVYPIYDFATKEEVIDALMASVHIPFFLDFKPITSYNGILCLDGSLQDFLYKSNSDILVRDSKIIFDYYEDDQLEFQRLDFMKLKQYEEICDLMVKGYDYARRLHTQGALDFLTPLEHPITSRLPHPGSESEDE